MRIRFLIFNIGVIAAGFIYVKLSIYYAETGWYEGIGDSVMITEWPKCTIQKPGLPWPSLLPHRTLNFFSNL